MIRRAFFVVGAIAAVVLIAGAVSVGAKQRLDSFAGSCLVQGTVTFDPPATNSAQLLAVAYDAKGECTGNLDGRRVANEHVTLHHAGQAFGSCSGAHTTGPGQGRITFADRTVIPYSFEFQSLGTEIDFDLYGQRSGTATGHGSFLTTRTSPDVVLECAGAGAAAVPMDMNLQTNSPLVSYRTGGGRSRP